VALIGLLIVVAVILWNFTARRYSGDGTFADKGFWALRPRYEIRFPEISLAKPGEYRFVSEGLPSVPLTFELEMADRHKYDEEMSAFFRQNPNKKWPGAGEKDRYEDIKRSRTWIEVTFSADGQIIASNAGSVKDAWILEWEPAINSGGLWHPQCRDIQFNPNRRYTLTLSIRDVDADAPHLNIVPMLMGGGNELP
jgi:hypothetical protein